MIVAIAGRRTDAGECHAAIVEKAYTRVNRLCVLRSTDLFQQIVDERRPDQRLGLAVTVAGELAPHRVEVAQLGAERTQRPVDVFRAGGVRQVAG